MLSSPSPLLPSGTKLTPSSSTFPTSHDYPVDEPHVLTCPSVFTVSSSSSSFDESSAAATLEVKQGEIATITSSSSSLLSGLFSGWATTCNILAVLHVRDSLSSSSPCSLLTLTHVGSPRGETSILAALALGAAHLGDSPAEDSRTYIYLMGGFTSSGDITPYIKSVVSRWSLSSGRSVSYRVDVTGVANRCYRAREGGDQANVADLLNEERTGFLDSNVLAFNAGSESSSGFVLPCPLFTGMRVGLDGSCEL